MKSCTVIFVLVALVVSCSAQKKKVLRLAVTNGDSQKLLKQTSSNDVVNKESEIGDKNFGLPRSRSSIARFFKQQSGSGSGCCCCNQKPTIVILNNGNNNGGTTPTTTATPSVTTSTSQGTDTISGTGTVTSTVSGRQGKDDVDDIIVQEDDVNDEQNANVKRQQNKLKKLKKGKKNNQIRVVIPSQYRPNSQNNGNNAGLGKSDANKVRLVQLSGNGNVNKKK